MSKERNIFISHYSKDEENIEKMKELLLSKNYKLKNSSIDKTKRNEAKNEDYIEKILKDRITWAKVFVCLIGPNTHKREWVDREIEEANKQGKRIVGVFINGAQNSDIPANLELFGDAVVGWTADKIIGAIEGEINNWENTDGTIRTESKWSVARESC